MSYKFIFLTLINFCYANPQTLIISYYNNSNCSDTSFKQNTFSNNCIINYDSCCRKILNKEEIKNNQNINTCYLNNNTKMSYYYSCTNNGYIIDNCVFILLLLSILILILCSIIIFGEKRKKSFKYRPINNFSYDT